MLSCPPERQDRASSTKTKEPVPPPPGSLHNPLNKTNPLGTDAKNTRNYNPAACIMETPNTVKVKKNEKTEKHTADEGAR